MLLVVACIVMGGMLGTVLLGRLLRVSPNLSLLIACGFSICGAAAVAVAVAAPGRRKPHPVSSTEAATVSDSARARPRLVVRAVPVGPDVSGPGPVCSFLGCLC